MNKIGAWLAAHNISAHTFTALVVGFMGLYTESDAFKAIVDSTVSAHPNIAKLLAAAVIIYARYAAAKKSS